MLTFFPCVKTHDYIQGAANAAETFIFMQLLHLTIKFILLMPLLFILGDSLVAQTIVEKSLKSYSCLKADEKAVRDYFVNFKELQKQIADAERKTRESQIAQFGRVLPKISGHCFGGCPTRLVKPYYPPAAKRLRIFGQVMIEAIVNENGQVIFAQPHKANPIFIQAARLAACVSSFSPQLFEGAPFKFRQMIVYNFIRE